MLDDKLLRKLRRDPEGGMKQVIDQYAALVWAVVKGRLAVPPFCTADIEACVADTFSEFYCDLEKYDPAQSSLRAWLCVLARHNALDHLRRHYKEAGVLSLDEEAAAQYADDTSLEGDFEDKAQRTALLEAIRALGDPDREILLRKYYLSQTSKEIADALHLTVSNVDTRAHRAIQKLRKQLGGDRL